jgi:hypothetical protein
MPRYTFSTEGTQLTAADRTEALALCSQGKVGLDAIVTQHGESRDVRFPISQDADFYGAVCDADGFVPEQKPKLSASGILFLVVSVASSLGALVCLTTFFTHDFSTTKTVGAFLVYCLFLAVFLKGYLKEKRRAETFVNGDFLREKQRITRLVKTGDCLATNLPLLMPTHQITARDVFGINHHGRVQLTHLSGKIADIEIQAQAGKICGVVVSPVAIADTI